MSDRQTDSPDRSIPSSPPEIRPEEPMQPMMPMQSMELMESVGTVDQMELMESMELVRPVKPTKQIQPMELSEPVELADNADSDGPADFELTAELPSLAYQAQSASTSPSTPWTTITPMPTASRFGSDTAMTPSPARPAEPMVAPRLRPRPLPSAGLSRATPMAASSPMVASRLRPRHPPAAGTTSATTSATPYRPARPFDRRLSAASVGLPASSPPSSPAPPTETISENGTVPAIRFACLSHLSASLFSRRRLGEPTSLAVGPVICVGTTSGCAAVFDTSQTIVATTSPPAGAGAVTAVAVSADGTAVATGHLDGDVCIWDVARPAKPLLHIGPVSEPPGENGQGNGHVMGTAVVHVGFLGLRRTAVVSADAAGMVFSHLATRGLGSVGRTVATTRLLGRYRTPGTRPGVVLAAEPLPVGNTTGGLDGLGLTAVVTAVAVAVVSTTPVAETQWQASMTVPETDAVVSGAASWFPAVQAVDDDKPRPARLAFALGCLVRLADVSTIGGDEPELADEPVRADVVETASWTATEPVVAVQWLSRAVMAVLTVSQTIHILEHDSGTALVLRERVDVGRKQLVGRAVFGHSVLAGRRLPAADLFCASFRAGRGRIFLLNRTDVSVAVLTTWADRLAGAVGQGDYVAALRMATGFFAGVGPVRTVGLPGDHSVRAGLVRGRIEQLCRAAAKTMANLGSLSPGPEDLTAAIFEACVAIGATDFLLDRLYDDYAAGGKQLAFFAAVEQAMAAGQLDVLPARLAHDLLASLADDPSAEADGRIEALLVRVGDGSADIELATTVCRRRKLWAGLAHVWTSTVGDAVWPASEMIRDAVTADGTYRDRTINHLFPFLAHVLTRRHYPTGRPTNDNSRIQSAIATWMFAAVNSDIPAIDGGHPVIRHLISLDPAAWFAVLNEFFEESIFADDRDHDSTASTFEWTRQGLLSLMRSIVASSPSTTLGSTTTEMYLDMFIARACAKYPQFVLLPPSQVSGLLGRLAEYPARHANDSVVAADCQLSVEFVLSAVRPDISALEPAFRNARFFRVLRTVLRARADHAGVVATWLDEPDEPDRTGAFAAIAEAVATPNPGVSANRLRSTIAAVADVVACRAGELTAIDPARTVRAIRQVEASGPVAGLAVRAVRAITDDWIKFKLLADMVTNPSGIVAAEPELVREYVRLLARFSPTEVGRFVAMLPSADLGLEAIVPDLENAGAVDAAALIVVREAPSAEARVTAVGRVVSHLSVLEAGLTECEDEDGEAETVAEMAKYARLGVWLSGHAVGADPNGDVRNDSEQAWVRLVAFLIALVHRCRPASAEIRSVVQEAFSVVLADTGPNPVSKPDLNITDQSAADSTGFVRRFTLLLGSLAESLSPFAAVRPLLEDVFSTYVFETAIVQLGCSIVASDLGFSMGRKLTARRRGWTPSVFQSGECSGCGKPAWSTGAGRAVWEAWQDGNRETESTAEEDADAVALFACKHVYHRRCLAPSGLCRICGERTTFDYDWREQRG